MQAKKEIIRVRFAALGCPKNLVDSEKMLGLLGESGMMPVGPDAAADVMVINTCGFIAAARDEAAEVIAEGVAAKRAGQVGRVVVVGCLAQKWANEGQARPRGVDAVVGLKDRDRIAEIVREVVSAGSADEVGLSRGMYRGPVPSDQSRLRLTERHWAYLRISEGCSRGCSFCTIPKIRGPYRSKPPEMVLAEAEELVKDGAIELNLIGQETTDYGHDIGYSAGLAGLIRELNGLRKLRWLRILYAHPASLSDDLIAAMAGCRKVVPYIDMPLQHINDRILKLMRRRVTRGQTEALLKRLRGAIDNLAIRTTMLVGFPTESRSEFEELLDFISEYRFEALGCFAWSAESGTAAAKMAGRVPERERLGRQEEIMLRQQEISFEYLNGFVGRQVDCLIDRAISAAEAKQLGLPSGGWYQGRHAGQAAEIDGCCYVRSRATERVAAGELCRIVVTGRSGYDLVGEVSTATQKNRKGTRRSRRTA